jgi:hypothetical protein
MDPYTKTIGTTTVHVIGKCPVKGCKNRRRTTVEVKGVVNAEKPARPGASPRPARTANACAEVKDMGPTGAVSAEPAATTVKQLTTGVRVLITNERRHAGAGTGTWRVARKLTRRGELTTPGEPAGVHAATVTEVRRSAARGRYDVVTNLGTVERVTGGQAFRLAPASMRDTADIRAGIATERETRESRQAYDRANPRDVDGVNVHPGELVELLDQGGAGTAGRPYAVVRAIGPYGGVGGLLVARPYERAYGGRPAGTGLALNFRRLADQTGGPMALRSCGCPATIRDAILPPPEDGPSGWRAVLDHIRAMDAGDRRHGDGCQWAGGYDERGQT